MTNRVRVIFAKQPAKKNSDPICHARLMRPRSATSAALPRCGLFFDRPLAPGRQAERGKVQHPLALAVHADQRRRLVVVKRAHRAKVATPAAFHHKQIEQEDRPDQQPAGTHAENQAPVKHGHWINQLPDDAAHRGSQHQNERQQPIAQPDRLAQR